MTVSDRDLFVIARAAGFSVSAAITAGAVALAESGGNPNATHRNTNGSTDYGLWQINSVHADLLRTHRWADAADNARMAYVISNGGRTWTPWTTYTSGRYRIYVGRMRAAAAGKGVTTTIPGAPSAGGSVVGGGAQPGAPLPAGSGSSGGLGSLLDSHTWIRVAMILGGVLLLALMIALAMGHDIYSLKRAVL